MDREEPPLRSAYRAFYDVPSRWLDNDVYGHVNNVNYYSYFDTAIAHYLMQEGGLDPWADPVIGYCVESGCRFRVAARFPDRITAGLKVTRLGRSSVTYAIGIFRNDDQQAAADGHFVHVFVERASERPAPIPERLRGALTGLLDEAD
jgi:acyl-CoA thioester hydrolase